MKASEIYELVRSWPREAWPCLEWNGSCWVADWATKTACPADHAALLFFASGMIWLQRQRPGGATRFWHCKDGHWHVDDAEYSGDIDDIDALLAALSAAITAVAGQGGGGA